MNMGEGDKYRSKVGVWRNLWMWIKKTSVIIFIYKVREKKYYVKRFVNMTH